MVAITKVFTWLNTQWNDCKNLPDVNSRISFLIHSGVGALCVLILTMAFIWKGNPSDYPWVLAALSGQAATTAWGRAQTKSASKESGNGKPPGKSNDQENRVGD